MKANYFYIDEFKKLSCYTYLDFITTLDMLVPDREIDVNTTCKCTGFHLYFKDGQNQYFGFYSDFYKYIKEELGLDIDLGKSYRALQEYTLYFNTVPDLLLGKPVVKEEVVEEVVEEIKEVLDIETKEEVVIDYDELNALDDPEDKKGSKKALEALVQEKYGVDLNARKSFANMIAELEEALGK